MAATTTCDGGFPRMRGDRPLHFAMLVHRYKFPPHARGSTAYSCRASDSHPVSPACAGIDRGWLASGRCGGGFPRMRGDRPILRTRIVVRSQFPPHARGSTLVIHASARIHVVSPACAGIDQRRDWAAWIGVGFPRMRGDRPFLRYACNCPQWFPPHARGSTLSCIEPCLRRRVSPACAGIDHGGTTPAKPGGRFPRMRGDRPCGDRSDRATAKFPPHARGSTYCDICLRVREVR